MKRRIKVFEAGKYPQGQYNFEKVKKIFGGIRDKVKSQLAHTSKAKGREIIMGDFSNFEVTGDGKVFADLEFNERGQRYYEDGALEGISVEIPNGKLTKIACLPLGVRPQIEGAEFEVQETFIFEFEEVEVKEEMDFDKVVAWLVANNLTVDQISKVFATLKTQVTDKEAIGKLAREFERVELSAEEEKNRIRAEIEAEFEKKERVKNAEVSAKEFMENNKLKLTPAMREVLTEDTLKEVFSVNNHEFGEEKLSLGSMLTITFDKMPEIVKLGEIEGEFGQVDDDYVENAKAQFGVE